MGALVPPVLAAAVIYAAWHAGAVWGLLAVTGCLGSYLVSLALLPQRRCRWCKGSKVREDTRFWRGAIGTCWLCGGSGKRIRWGVILLMRGTYKAIKAGEHGRNF
jgi:hypothetical protein